MQLPHNESMIPLSYSLIFHHKKNKSLENFNLDTYLWESKLKQKKIRTIIGNFVFPTSTEKFTN